MGSRRADDEAKRRFLHLLAERVEGHDGLAGWTCAQSGDGVRPPVLDLTRDGVRFRCHASPATGFVGAHPRVRVEVFELIRDSTWSSLGQVSAPSLEAGVTEMAHLSALLDQPAPLDADEVVIGAAGALATGDPPIPLTHVEFDASSLAGRTDVSSAAVGVALDRLDPDRIARSFPRDRRGWPASQAEVLVCDLSPGAPSKGPRPWLVVARPAGRARPTTLVARVADRIGANASHRVNRLPWCWSAVHDPDAERDQAWGHPLDDPPGWMVDAAGQVIDDLAAGDVLVMPEVIRLLRGQTAVLVGRGHGHLHAQPAPWAQTAATCLLRIDPVRLHRSLEHAAAETGPPTRTSPAVLATFPGSTHVRRVRIVTWIAPGSGAAVIGTVETGSVARLPETEWAWPADVLRRRHASLAG